MKTHDQFFLAQRAHNLLIPLVNEAKEQGIKVTLNFTLGLGEPFGSPLLVHVWEIKPGEDLHTLAYSTFSHNESLKDWMDQLDGVAEHVRDTLAARRDLMELAA